MRQDTSKIAQLILVIISIVSITSVGATYDSYNTASDLLLSEHDKQLSEVANSIDYSLSTMLSNDSSSSDDEEDWQEFYYDAVDSKLFNKYWIAFYDEDTGMLLQNDMENQMYSVIAPENLEGTDERYKNFIEYIKKGKTGSVSYSYKNSDGGKSTYRGVVIPSSKSQNGQISIMVSSDSTYIINSMRSIMTMLMMSVAATVISVVALVITIYTRSKNQSMLEDQLADLKKETEYTKELLEQQAEIEHHQRLEYLGTLTAGIAHEFNNMLTPIIGYSLLLLNETAPEDNEHYDELLEIYNSADKARKLVKRLSLISGKGNRGETRIVNPNELITNAIKLLEPIREENVLIYTELNATKQIRFDETRFSQIFINLITNAYHALEPDGGMVGISTEDKGDSIVIKVSDTGCGIADEIKEKIFEPFYTTKGPHRGTGLGLAIVRQILQNNMSEISLESKVGEGTCFTITIPCAEDYESAEGTEDYEVVEGSDASEQETNDDEELKPSDTAE
jgi:signal transduction histidine kinase